MPDSVLTMLHALLFQQLHAMCTPASHFMELIEGKQLLKVTDITHGRTRIPVHGGLSSKSGVFNLDRHFLRQSVEGI